MAQNNNNGQAKKFYNENMIVFTGNVMSEPEFKYTPQGIALLSWRMGIGCGEKTVWVKVQVWREKGEALSQYVKKGMKVTVYGRLNNNQAYQQKDGTLACALEINADQVSLPAKGEGEFSTGNAGKAASKPLPEQDITEEEGAAQEQYPF